MIPLIITNICLKLASYQANKIVNRFNQFYYKTIHLIYNKSSINSELIIFFTTINTRV